MTLSEPRRPRAGDRNNAENSALDFGDEEEEKKERRGSGQSTGQDLDSAPGPQRAPPAGSPGGPRQARVGGRPACPAPPRGLKHRRPCGTPCPNERRHHAYPSCVAHTICLAANYACASVDACSSRGLFFPGSLRVPSPVAIAFRYQTRNATKVVPLRRHVASAALRCWAPCGKPSSLAPCK